MTGGVQPWWRSTGPPNHGRRPLVTAGDIALVITAVAGLITAVAGLIGVVQRRRVQDVHALETERNGLRRYVEALLLHIHVLRLLLAEQGIEAPEVPDETEMEAVT